LVCYELDLYLLPYVNSLGMLRRMVVNFPSLGRGMLAQGYDLTKNSYHNRFQPYIAYWGAGWTLFFILINGFSVFWDFNASGFLTACACDPLVPTDITLTPIPQISTSRYFWFYTLAIKLSSAPSSGSCRRWTSSLWVQMIIYAPSLLTFSYPGHPDARRNRDTRKTSKEFRRTCRQYYFLNMSPGS